MSEDNLAMDGSCRCGRVKIRISAKPMITMACHCTGCQKMSSGAFSLSAAIPTQGFAVTEGEPVIGGLHGAAKHYFCPHCMSWMFTRPDGADFFVNVRSTMLAYPDKFAPFVETYLSEKLAWATTSAVHSYDKFPPMEDFPRLMQEYAALPA